MLHHVHELGAPGLLQPWVLGQLGGDRGVAAALVVVRRIDERRARQLQQLVEQAVEQRVRVARRQIGASGAADEQRVAREHPVFHHQAHRVAGMAGRVQRLQAQLPGDEHIPVVHPERGVGGRAQAVHDHRSIHQLAELMAGGEMIGMRVGVHDVTDVEAVVARQSPIAVDPRQLRVDEHRGPCRLAAQQVGLTTARCDLFKDHVRASCWPADDHA